MPLPTKVHNRAHPFDVLLSLREYSAAALSATGSATGLAYAVRDEDVFKVVVNHGAITGTINGSNNWVITVEVSDVVGGTYTQVATTGQLGAAAAEIELAISGQNVAQLDSDAAFIRVTATKTGTVGNLTYGAFVTPAM